jgi:hypothetical protein
MPGIREGFRERLLAFVRVTTGIQTNISANGSTITRASGSFLANGFQVGEEVTFSGWLNGANNGVGMIESLTASTMVIADRTFVTEVAGGPVTVEVKVPALRKYENRALKTVVGRPYLVEKLVFPTPTQRQSIGPVARVKVPGVYEIQLFYPPNMGTVPIDSMASGLVLWFHSGVPPLPLENGSYLHLRSASRLGAIREEPTKCSVTVSIAFDSYITNPL